MEKNMGKNFQKISHSAFHMAHYNPYFIDSLRCFSSQMYLYNKVISVPVHVVILDPLNSKIYLICDVCYSYASMLLQCINQGLIRQQSLSCPKQLSLCI